MDENYHGANYELAKAEADKVDKQIIEGTGGGSRNDAEKCRSNEQSYGTKNKKHKREKGKSKRFKTNKIIR